MLANSKTPMTQARDSLPTTVKHVFQHNVTVIKADKAKDTRCLPGKKGKEVVTVVKL